MRILGVYFGPQIINIVELLNKKPINNIQVSHSIFSQGEILDEKVPEEIKIITVLKDELAKNQIKTKDAVFNLSGKDLIIRNFEMPMMPLQELEGAISFEVSKYIPFKTQDLVSDFQSVTDRTLQKIHVLFAAIKKDTLDKYVYIASQLGLHLKAVEYSAFSILRLLKLNRIKEKGVIGVLDIDITKNDEVNLVVLENGFPLFSRDITLISGSSGFLKDEEMVLDKLKREIRVSLDYYRNKLPLKKINSMFLIMEQNYRQELEGLIKERDLPLQFIDIDKYITQDKLLLSPLAFVKSYSAGLHDVKIALKINLLSAKDKATQKVSVKKREEKPSIFKAIKLDPKVALAAIFICVGAYFFGQYKIKPLQSELNNLSGNQPSVAGVTSLTTYEELLSINAAYNIKIGQIDNILNKRVYLTELLDVIPHNMFSGMTLTAITFRKQQNKTSLIIGGNVYLGDGNKEVEGVNSFILGLKGNAVFKKHFSDITITSINQTAKTDKTVTEFLITCEGK